MRLIIVRHGEPDYSIDGLTEKGKLEVKALADKLEKEKIDYVYVSPLGRAQLTAKAYLNRVNKSYETLPWLRELWPTLEDYETHEQRRPWDFKVEYFNEMVDFRDNSKYLETPVIKNSTVHDTYYEIVKAFDELLAKHGYVRNKKGYYDVTNSNKDTLIFFCHLGIESVLLSRLFNMPFVMIAQHFSPAPSSVTTIYTEERKPGIAQFRAQTIGDVSHLYAAGLEVSFMARYRENYFDDTRAD